MSLTGILLADFSAFITEAAKAATATKGMEQSADAAAAKLSKMGDNVAKSIQSGISDPMGTASEAMKGFGEAIGGVSMTAAIAVGGVTALAGSVFTLATNAAEATAAFDDMADKTGMSVPVLSRYSNAAKVIGADMNQLTDIVFKLERGMGENSDAFQAGLAAMGTSTEELRAAGPDRYLELVTNGLKSIADPSARAAAGNAVLGRGYKDVAAALNDLDAGLKLTSDLEPFTAKQAADAEAFQFQLASIKTHLGDAAIVLGQELIPATSLAIDGMVRMAVAVKNVADLGGLVSGAYKGMKLTLGEAALAQETFNAVAGTTNRLFQEQGATAASVAEKMLTMGYSEKTVAEQTGLTAEAVRALNIALITTKQEAEDMDKVWGRVNTALAAGAPSIEGVSAATRGLVADMQAAGVSVKDMAAATGLTVAQINLLTKANTEAATAFKEWQKATEAVNASMVGWQTTLDTIDGAVVEAVKIGLSAGVSQADLAKAYDLTAQQVKAVQIALEDYASTLASTADFEKAAADRRLEISKLMTKAINDEIVATLKKKQADDAANQAFLDAALKDAQAQDAMQQGVTTTADTTKKAANDMGGAYEDSFRRSAAAFESFKGVVVAGTQQMNHDMTTIQGRFESFTDLLMRTPNANPSGMFAGMPVVQTRDVGGPVEAGQSYLIGGGRAPEIFTPGASGFVTPTTATAVGAGGSAAVGGVTVNNVFNIVDTEANITRRVSDTITRSIMQAQKL